MTQNCANECGTSVVWFGLGYNVDCDSQQNTCESDTLYKARSSVAYIRHKAIHVTC